MVLGLEKLGPAIRELRIAYLQRRQHRLVFPLGGPVSDAQANRNFQQVQPIANALQRLYRARSRT